MQVINNSNEKPQFEAVNKINNQRKGKESPVISSKAINKKAKSERKRVLAQYKKQSVKERMSTSTLESTETNSNSQQGSTMINDLRHAFAKFDLMEMEESGSYFSDQTSP